MVDLLLSDEVEKMESQLIDILVCTVRQAATGEYPIGRGSTKRGAPASKESKMLVEDRTRLSEVLIPAFPQIMQKVKFLLIPTRFRFSSSPIGTRSVI